MKHCVIGSSISIMCFIIMSQTEMSASRSTLSSTRSESNPSHYSPENTTRIWRGRSNKRWIKNDTKTLDRLKTIRADHYKRKVAFLEKELEICFSQIEEYHQTTSDLRDHFTSMASIASSADLHIITTPKSHGSSEVRKSTTVADFHVNSTSNGHRSSKVRTSTTAAALGISIATDNHGLSKVDGKSTDAADVYLSTTALDRGLSIAVNYTEAETVNLDGWEDHNFNVTELEQLHQPDLAIFWQKEAELSTKEEHFRTQEFTTWDISVDIEFLFFSFKTFIEQLEKLYKSHIPKVIMYEDVADKMETSFVEDEIVHAHLLLCVMEKLNLIQRNGISTEKIIPPMPMDKLQEIITPRTARWVLFLLFGQHASLSTMRSKVESEARLTLYEFCWSISKTWDVGDGVHSYSDEDGVMASSWMQEELKEFMELPSSTSIIDSSESGEKVNFGPFFRSMYILLEACENGQ